MRCRYVYDEEVGKFHIPGCWGSAVYGPGHCTCYPKKEKTEADSKALLIKDLEKENARLNRIIKNLLKRK